MYTQIIQGLSMMHRTVTHTHTKTTNNNNTLTCNDLHAWIRKSHVDTYNYNVNYTATYITVSRTMSLSVTQVH